MDEKEYMRIMRELLDLINIEQYGVKGVLSDGRLVVSGFMKGRTNVYIYDGEKLEKLNSGPVYTVVEAYKPSSRALIARDVASGKEQSQLIVLDPDNPGTERVVEDMKPLRILGVVYDDERIVYAGGTMSETALYVVEAGRARRVTVFPSIAYVTDFLGDLAVGLGMFSGQHGKMDVFITDLTSGETRFHSPEKGSVETARFSPDGSVIYAVEGDSHAYLEELDPYSLEARPYRARHGDLEEYLPVGFNYIGFTGKGELLAIARREGRSKVFVDGKQISLPPGFYSSIYRWRSGFVASYSSSTKPQRVLYFTEKGSSSDLLAGKEPGWLEEALGETRLTYVESFDGEKIPVFYAESKRAGRPGPTVVLVHGGPFAEEMDVWSIMTASLLAAGFNVVKPNYRGSTGYGLRWRLKIIGDPCGGELEDITSTAKWALRQGIADKIYIMGYSYGGYMTLCSLARKPGLYRAGVAGASVVDWEEMYKLSDAVFKEFIDLLFGGKRELLRDRSPITYADNIREPLAIIHAANDTRTPLKPVLRLMEKLSEKEKRFEAHIHPEMGHYIATADDAVRILLPALIFLARTRET